MAQQCPDGVCGQPFPGGQRLEEHKPVGCCDFQRDQRPYPAHCPGPLSQGALSAGTTWARETGSQPHIPKGNLCSAARPLAAFYPVGTSQLVPFSGCPTFPCRPSPGPAAGAAHLPPPSCSSENRAPPPQSPAAPALPTSSEDRGRGRYRRRGYGCKGGK